MPKGYYVWLLDTAGVALLALDSLITGCWLLFIMRTFYVTFLGSSIETLQSQVTPVQQARQRTPAGCVCVRAQRSQKRFV